MKLKQTHTPGKWQTGALMSRVEVLPEGWNAPLCVADCGTKHAPESEDERCANARLIAAAPAMLAALEKCQQEASDQLDGLRNAPHTSNFCSGTCHRCAGMKRAAAIYETARAALAQAERGDK
jgi:hypothetical protein